MSEVEEQEMSSVVPVSEHHDPNTCPRCSKTIKKKFSLFNSRKDCFICDRSVCTECLSKEERYETSTGKKGYACLDCYPKTKVSGSPSLFPGVFDINPALDALESRIPHQLDNMSSKLDGIATVKDELANVREEVSGVGQSLVELLKLIRLEVEDVKGFSQDFTQRNWKIIRRDIYKILVFSALGIIVLAGVLAVEIILIIKLFFPG